MNPEDIRDNVPFASPVQPVERVADPELEVGGDLIVARPGGVQPSSVVERGKAPRDPAEPPLRQTRLTPEEATHSLG